MTFDFNNAVFTYAVSNKQIDRFSRHLPLETQNLVINYTDATAVQHFVSSDCEVVIIGLCIDAHGMIKKEDIASAIVGQTNRAIDAIFAFASRFSGKYIILYSDTNGCYAFGDATCSIPINFAGSLGTDEICLSPFDGMTADYFGYVPDSRLARIRKAADPAQTMPGDLTPYTQVKALLPNQYLNMFTGRAIRVKMESLPTLSFNEIIDRSILLSQNAAAAFAEYYQLICPLTSGYDSRVVLAILCGLPSEVKCFTTVFSSSGEENADIRIAKAICERKGLNHSLFGYDDPPEEFVEAAEKAAGMVNSRQTIKEAYNFVVNAGSKARINGNIIGQIGKSSVTNCVPDLLASASFLACKIHNRDRQCIPEMKRYRADLGKSSDLICDMFAYENRCGRWGGQEEALYSLCGMNSLNIFNCRELILYWISIPRKQRTKKAIHTAMIGKTEPELLNEPFNPDDHASFLKSNWLFYYFATFAKQMLTQMGIQCD